MTVSTVISEENARPSDRQADAVAFTLDPAGCVSSWNADAERAYGWRADEITGQPYSTLLSAEGDAGAGVAQGRLDRAASHGRCEDTLLGLRKDRTQFRASLLLAPLCDPAGTLLGFAHVVRDVSARVQMAHDFNNLSQVCQTAIEALRLSLPGGNPAVARLLETLKRNVGRTSDMMQAVLELPGAASLDTAPEPPRRGSLAGLRVLVVEDESLIALHVEDMLEQLGCEVIGLAGTVDKALACVASLEMDLVLLDMNLHGAVGEPVAEAVKARKIPLVLMTGDQQMEKAWPQVPKVRKPFELGQMRSEIERALKDS